MPYRATLPVRSKRGAVHLVRQSFHQAVRKPCASILCMIIVRVHTEAWIYRLRNKPFEASPIQRSTYLREQSSLT